MNELGIQVTLRMIGLFGSVFFKFDEIFRSIISLGIVRQCGMEI